MDECKHTWISNSGQGGKAVFKPIGLGPNIRAMHVKCSICNCRTWLSKEEWLDYEKQRKKGNKDG